MANVLYGLDSTHKIDLKNIIQHTLSVKMGIKKSLLVVDMPKGTYNDKNSAIKNAKQVLKLTKCDGVKLESNYKNFHIIKYLVKKAKIPVMGHIGFTPQFKKKFKIEGDTVKKANKLLKEAKLIEKAGAFSIVLECITSKTSKLITECLKIPTIGIGSSKNCDGQILVTDDMLGIKWVLSKICQKIRFIGQSNCKSCKKI